MSQIHALDFTAFQNRKDVRSECVETSFYSLIEALSEQVSEGEERLVVEAVKDLCERGLVTLPGGRTGIMLNER